MMEPEAFVGLPDIDAIVQRVRGEFLEMPDLRLTRADAARFWGLEPDACGRVVDALLGCAFLRMTPAGMLARVDERKHLEMEQ